MKYGKPKYSKCKYGRYELPTDQDKALSQGVRYRIRSIRSDHIKSSPIVNSSITFPTSDKSSAIRIRSDKSSFVVQQSEHIDRSVYKIRVKSIANGVESPWVESVVGTIKLKGV